MSQCNVFIPKDDVLNEIRITFMKLKDKNSDVQEEYLNLIEKINRLYEIYGIRIEEEDDLK